MRRPKIKSVAEREQELKRLFSYDPETGNLYCKEQYRTGLKEGDKVGNLDSGYLKFSFYGKYYGCHRVAWFLYYGHWPNVIDHINGNPSDNRIVNLRNVTHAQNMQNKSRHRSGRLLGTTKTDSNRWQSKIRVNRKDIHIGTFDTELEAHEAYLNYAKINNIPCLSTLTMKKARS